MKLGFVNNSKLCDRLSFVLMMRTADAVYNGRYTDLWDRKKGAPSVDYQDVLHVPLDSTPVIFQDRDTAEPDAAGYHFNPNDRPTIIVLVEPTTSNGGGLIDGGSTGESVFQTLMHEIFERAGNPFCNAWSDAPGTKWQLAVEHGDPFQGVPLWVNAPDGTRMLSADSALPAYFDADAKPGSREFDLAGACDRPFRLLTGGYQIKRTYSRLHEGNVFAHKEGRGNIGVEFCPTVKPEVRAHKTRPGSRYSKIVARHLALDSVQGVDVDVAK